MLNPAIYKSGVMVLSCTIAASSLYISAGHAQGGFRHIKTVEIESGQTSARYELVRQDTETETVSSGGVYYRLSRDGGKTYGNLKLQDPKIKLRSVIFDPLRPEKRRHDLAQKAGLPVSSGNLHLVQVETQFLREYKKRLREVGASVVAYIPRQTYVVRMDSSNVDAIAALPFVRWTGPYDTSFKLSLNVLNDLQTPEKGESTRYVISLFTRDSDEVGSVVKAINEMGGRTLNRGDVETSFLEAVLTQTQLVRLLDHDNVQFVEEWTPPEEDMNIVRQVTGADFLELQVPFYTGVGVTGEVMDDGLRTTHTDINATINAGNSSDNDHGTSVFGIVFGDGTSDNTARGMLPDGNGVFSSYSAVTNRAMHTAGLVNPNGGIRAVFQTNSWGDARTTAYTNISAQMDEIIFDNDILITQSQSNAGNQNSRPQAWAKNIVSIGGINHENTAALADDNWSNSASIGPAADGRIKPDLSHFYDFTRTTGNASDTAYRDFGGTSGATPITAGHFGLFFQMWADGIFIGEGLPGSGGDVFNARPHAATAKAMLINTAQQYAFNGQTHDLTRVHQGWGLPNVRNLYELAEDNNWRLPLVVNEDYPLTDGQTQPFTIRVTGTGGLPWLRATLVYMDPPGSPAAAVATVNNLDLRLTSPGGTVYWGNAGLLNGNWSTAGGSPSAVDTVENVFVQNAELGDWTVEILADQVVQDAHVETAAVDADFALVVTCEGVNRCTDVTDGGFAWLIPIINLILF